MFSIKMYSLVANDKYFPKKPLDGSQVRILAGRRKKVAADHDDFFIVGCQFGIDSV